MIVRLLAALVMMIAAALAGCDDDARKPVQTDAAPLIRRIELPAGIGAVRWRARTIPDSSGRVMVPGPTDYQVLYAYIELDEAAARTLTPAGAGSLELPADVVDILPATARANPVVGDAVRLVPRVANVTVVNAIRVAGGLVVQLSIDLNVPTGK